MTALERLRREGQRETARFYLRNLWPFLFGAICFVAGYGLCLRQHEPSSEPSQTVEALKDVSDSLRVVRSLSDSLRHVDSVGSAIAIASRDSVRARQPRVDSVIAAATVAKPSVVTADSLPPFTVEGPAATPRAWVVLTDTAWNVPLPVARQMSRSIDAVEQAQDQLHISAVALHDAESALATKDERIGVLEKADSLAKKQDGLHVKRERELEGERDSAFRRGLKRGITGTVKVAAVVIVAVKIVSVARK